MTNDGQRHLGSHITLVSGQHVPTADVRADGRGMPYITGPSQFVRGRPVTKRTTEKPRATCQSGDILLTVKGSGTGTIALADQEYAISRQLMAVRPREWDALFVFELLSRQVEGLRRSAVGLIPGITRRDVMNIPVPNYPLQAQKEVGKVLSTMRHVETLVEQVASAKGRFQRALAQQLLTGKRRFKEFEPVAWVERRLGDVTEETTIRNAEGLPLGRVMAVRKDVGIVPMKEGVASEDLQRYKIVEPRRFAYNPMRLNIGSIAMWTGKGKVLVSPDYVVFRTLEDQLKSEYLKHVIHTSTWANHLVRVGSGGVRVRIWYDDLAGMRLQLPPAEEQTAIAALLSGLDEEIRLLGLLRDALDRQRRGVAELLLTGRVQVPA